jgi:predicted RNase H-like HicB family nuclease
MPTKGALFMSRKNVVTYPIILHSESDGGYSVEIPDVENGSWTQGETIEESILMAQDLIGAMLEDKNEFPKATPLEDIEIGINDIKTIALVDMGQYRTENSKTVRKNVSVPEYLIKLGKKENLNFSEVLTEALRDRLDV